MRLKKPDQKFLLFCAISMLTGILAGIFLAVKCRTGNSAAGIFSPYYLKEYAYLDIDRRKLMLIVAKERGKWLLLCGHSDSARWEDSVFICFRQSGA